MGDRLQNGSNTNTSPQTPPVVIRNPNESVYQEGAALSPQGGEAQEIPLNAMHHRLYPEWQSTPKFSFRQELPNAKREKWANKVEFIMVSLSVAVGVGNVWRFPFTAYENGGGAFLIPYLIVKMLIAQPLYFLELAIGQFCSQSPVGIWDCVPLLRGVGWAIVAVSTLTGVYYVSVLATCTMYIFYGLQSSLPWDICDEKLFHSYSKDSYIFRDNFAHFKCKSTYNNKTRRTDHYGEYYPNPNNKSDGVTRIHSTELFYQYVVMRAYDHVEDGIGTPNWEMSLALLFVWTLAFINMSLGTKSSGKGAYFTALFPYLVLLILFARACFLDGSEQGILFFLTPHFTKLLDIKVWYEAMSQAFFSLGIGYGNIIVFGSCNPLHQAAYYDTLIIAVADTFTSLLAGLTVFAILGGLSASTGKKIEDVVKVLGIGSSAAIVHVISATLLDLYPCISNKQWYKVLLVGCICFTLYLSGLILCTPGGPWLVEIFDYFGAGFIVFLLVMLEIAGIAYFYGMKNFERDMMFMFPEYKCTTNCKIFSIWERVPDSDLGRRSWKTRSWYKKWMASVTPIDYWGPKDTDEKLEWLEFKRDYDGSTLLWRNTIGKLKWPLNPEHSNKLLQGKLYSEISLNLKSSVKFFCLKYYRGKTGYRQVPPKRKVRIFNLSRLNGYKP
ncbi:unnamed protein product [Allacma fusca]|uniref:Transporter n=1 Tax=Allacma fusca TaxID=39272 RepID=A0A8J2KF39_9HEXA|nr:unnamed protein product [Allacma fusca]CAG7785630.1 unnamed protein product [Allacma fusca]